MMNDLTSGRGPGQWEVVKQGSHMTNVAPVQEGPEKLCISQNILRVLLLVEKV